MLEAHNICLLYADWAWDNPRPDLKHFAKSNRLGLPEVRKALAGIGGNGDIGPSLTEMVVAEIQRCADELGLPVHQLGGSQFVSWIKGHTEPRITTSHAGKLGGFLKVRDANFPAVKPASISVEKARVGQYALNNRRFNSKMTEQRVFLDEFANFAKCWENKAKPLGKPPAQNKNVERVVTVVLSDLHYGSNIAREETGFLDFGVQEERRRTAKLAREVSRYKPQYRSETKLVVLLLGDVIENMLHGFRDGADIAEQCSRATHYLLHFFQYVAAHYGSIEVKCNSGNHDRNKFLHEQRATSKKYDSYATIIYDSLAKALQPIKHIKFEIPKLPWNEYEMLGRRFYATHGDTNLNPGNPSQSLPIGKLEAQTNRIISGRGKFDVFIVGHTHVSSNVELTNGATLLTNGCMVPVGPYAVGLNIHAAPCSQWLFETTADHAVGDARRITLDAQTDQDESLDQIIPLWTGYGNTN